VEQDAVEIWNRTLGVCREALDAVTATGTTVAGLSIATQRATVLVWDTTTGEPLSQAVVWQDRRYVAQLRQWEPDWDGHLLEHTGRPVGSRAPLFWAAREVAENVAARRAYERGRLAFGSIDSWLVWQLTAGRRHVVSATNAVALGAYDLRSGDWHDPWLDFVECPRDILPDIIDDDGDFGVTARSVLGLELPILSVMGDQHAAMVSLNAHGPGQAVCVHGTGTFVDAIVGDQPPSHHRQVDGVLTLVGWRTRSRACFSLEAYAATTGSAVRWLCEGIGLFDSPEQIGALAADFRGRPQVQFLPALAGLRTPMWVPEATGAFTGLSLSTTRAELARGILDGCAQTVCDLLEGVEHVMERPVTQLTCGGGLATSDRLMQSQADALGRPVHRVDGHESASLRGTAYLGGVKAGLWESLATVVDGLDVARVFEPVISDSQREESRGRWRQLLAAHVAPLVRSDHRTKDGSR